MASLRMLLGMLFGLGRRCKHSWRQPGGERMPKWLNCGIGPGCGAGPVQALQHARSTTGGTKSPPTTAQWCCATMAMVGGGMEGAQPPPPGHGGLGGLGVAWVGMAQAVWSPRRPWWQAPGTPMSANKALPALGAPMCPCWSIWGGGGGIVGRGGAGNTPQPLNTRFWRRFKRCVLDGLDFAG
jgi:hypothetical protein